MESSDNHHIHKQNTQTTSSTRSTFDTQSSLSDVAVQQVNNVQILSQLSVISDRLQVLEKNNVKKIRIRKKSREFPKRNPVHKLPRSQCHQHMLGLVQN